MTRSPTNLLRRAGALLLALAAALAAPGAAGEPAPKVLRVSFRVAETGFDPVQVSDLYSRTVTSAIFDAPLQWAFLARPVRMQPNTLVAMPEVSADFTTFTFRVKPGIFFADDPAFKGQRRELVAADYVYAWKRHYDPRWKSPNLYLLEAAKLLDLPALREQALKGQPFDYDREVDGLRTLDRYTFQLRTGQPNPRLLHTLTDGSVFGAVAREVVEAYGDKMMEHPVGTGPFRLAQWRRASKIVLERNPGFRELYYDEQPPAGDPLAVAAAAALKGRRLPMIDRVEIAIIEESQPRWLAFLRHEHDVLDEVPAEYSEIAFPNNRLAPHLAKRGIAMVRYQRPSLDLTYFNMEDPLVGGFAPEKVALRRAIALAVDGDKERRLVWRNQVVLAQGVIPPGQWGHDPALRSEMGTFDRARAKALLDLYGYVDRDGDGWRDQPDGRPLRLEYATQPDALSRAQIELWQKNMEAIGIRIAFKAQKWPENLKQSSAGKLMMWGVGWLAGSPDGDTFLSLAYGPAKGHSNKSRFDLPAFNALYERQKVMPDGPERQALIDEAQRLLVAYMPIKGRMHRISTDLAHPWVIGYHRNPFVREAWRWVDIDTDLQRRNAP